MNQPTAFWYQILSLSLSLSLNSVLSISLFGMMPQRLVDPSKFQRISNQTRKFLVSEYIIAIYGFLFCNRRKKSFNSRVRFHCINLPTYSSDTESDGSSESNESPPRSSYSMESIETIFPPWRSPNHSDSFENFEEIFPIDHFISTSSTRTPQHK